MIRKFLLIGLPLVLLVSVGGATGCAATYPESPEQVVISCLTLMHQKEYSEAEKFFTRECLDQIRSEGGWHEFEEFVGGRTLQEITIEDVDILGDTAEIDAVVYYTDGSKEDASGMELVKQEERWKIDCD